MTGQDELKAALPAYAKDLKLNLGAVLTAPTLTPVQIWGTALACAMAGRNPVVLRAIAADAAGMLDAPTRTAARTAAALMSMNNVYYRFVHLMGESSYKTLPAQLRMNGIASHGISALDFELFALAVSAINGCGMCIESHERVVREKGASVEMVRDVVRIAATLQAVSVTLDAEANAPSA